MKGKKWVYWHRIIWADNECEEGAQLKTGELLGLDHKDTQCARLVRKESTKSIDIVDYVKLKFVGRMLRTATPEEVVRAFGPAKLDAEALKAHQEQFDDRGVPK